MHYKVVFTAMIALSTVTGMASSAKAQDSRADGPAGIISACGQSLVIDQASYADNVQMQLAILTYALSRSSDDKSFSSTLGGITGYGFFDGTFGGAQSKKAELEKQLNYSFTNNTASSFISSTLSQSGATSFDHCIEFAFEHQTPGLSVSLSRNSIDSATVSVLYKPFTGVEQPKLKIYANGAMPKESLSLPSSGLGNNGRDFTILKVNPAKELDVQIELLRSDGTVLDSKSVTAAPFLTVEKKTSSTVLTSDGVTKALCGGYHRYAQVTGNTVEIRSPDTINTVLDLSTLDLIRLPIDEQGDYHPAAGKSELQVNESENLVRVNAFCDVADWNLFYEIRGIAKVNAITTTYSIVFPVDNGKLPKYRVVAE